MGIDSIAPITRVILIICAFIYLFLILFMLKKKRLTVRYAIIWLLSSFVFIIFAIAPYTVLVLRDLLKMEMPVNVVFVIVFCFVLLLLLSLSSIISGFADKIKSLTQQQALLEKRVREMEHELKENSKTPK